MRDEADFPTRSSGNLFREQKRSARREGEGVGRTP